jgi:hypothetical protein
MSGTPTFGSNVIGLRFEKDGLTYSDAFPHETSRGGSERYFCDTDKSGMPDHVFQIRWNTPAGPVKADGKPVTLSIELLRSFNPPPLNIMEPWRNSLEALRPTELAGQAPQIRLMRDTAQLATEVAKLMTTYTGRGIFTVTRTFSREDLGGQKQRTFWLHVRFTDDKECVIDGADETEYHFAVSE